MVREFERKLRLTAALIGANTRKDLARAFHRVNPATSFDLDRAAKWLQGRAHPRELALYEDWAAILQLERPLAWLLECDLAAFVDALSARHGIDAMILAHRADTFGRPRPSQRPSAEPQGGTAFLGGIFVCYRHAFSPYFRGRLLRASLVVSPTANGQLQARYSEALPTGPDHAVGPVSAAGRSLFIDLESPAVTSDRAFLSLFMPQPPASCLAGLYCGATLFGPQPEPSCSRLIAVRVPTEEPALVETCNRYLEPAESLADDLAGHGMVIEDRAGFDRALGSFLQGRPAGGLEQVQAAPHADLVYRLDQIWIASRPAAEQAGAPALVRSA